MEAFIRDQIIAVAKHMPFHMLAGYFKKRCTPEVEDARRKLGGFMKGICHPSENFEQIKGAGIEWNRMDIPFPIDKEGNIRQDYLDWKNKARRYQASGIRVMAVTPYPRTYIEYGIDPRLPENEARVRELAIFMLEDLRGLAEVFQITNEMGLPQFMKPLNIQEAVRFIGIQAEAMHPRKGDVLVGYNSSGPQSDLHQMMKPWHKYCDYIGIDIYLGCFVAAGNYMWMHDALLRYLWSMTGKPILLCEFGYISGGIIKTPEEKKAVLKRYGVSSEQEARENVEVFMAHLKEKEPKMWSYVERCHSGNPADYLFNSMYRNHFYAELPKGVVIKGYPHTPEGQADYYRDVFPRLAKLPYVLGAIIYAWKDSERCGYCGQGDCPQETRWGLVDQERKEKPSYYAVRKALDQIQ